MSAQARRLAYVQCCFIASRNNGTLGVFLMGTSIITHFPLLADFISVWALSIADFFRPLGINFPLPNWGF